MTPVGLAKLALAVSGIVVFLLGINTGNEVVRWTGVGLVVVAWLLRFVGEERQSREKHDEPRARSPHDSSEDA